MQILYSGLLWPHPARATHLHHRWGAPEAEIFVFKFLPWPGFEPRTSQSNDRERYHSTTASSRHVRDVLQRLPISPRIQYRITAMVSRCVLFCDPSYMYLCDLCCPVSVLAARRVLRCAAMGELLVPRAHLATDQRRALSVVGPSAGNDLPVELRSLLMALPNFTFPSSLSCLAVTGLGSPLSSSVLKRFYISLQNESGFFIFKTGAQKGLQEKVAFVLQLILLTLQT